MDIPTPTIPNDMSVSSVKHALSDREAVALTMWGEARGESLAARGAVGMGIKNRRNHPRRWSNDWRQVCHQRWQFSCWQKTGGAANHAAVMAWARYYTSIDSRRLQPPSTERRSVAECLYLADGVLGGFLLDNTHGSDHYYAPRAMVPAGSAPKWAENQTPTAIIDNQRFFRLAV